MQRRELIRAASLAGGAGILSACSIRRVDGTATSELPRVRWRMATSWPHALDTIYGGAQTIADQVGAMNFAFCIMGALMARERHGVGQKVETSQLGAMIQFQSADILAPWHTGEQRDDGLPARVNDVVLVSEGRLQAALARVPYD